MKELKYKMIKEAIKKYKEIYPVVTHKKLLSCFTREKDTLIFWFNTKDGSTHVLMSRLN